MMSFNNSTPGDDARNLRSTWPLSDQCPAWDLEESAPSAGWNTPPPWDSSSAAWDLPPSFAATPTAGALGGGLWDTDKTVELDLSERLAAKLLMVAPDCLDDEFQGQEGTSNPRFKTEICRNYKEKGTCVYSDNCQFAHGRDELRMRDRNMNVTQDVVRHNKYKTKLCQKFWIAGYCAYGPRCNFIHNEAERPLDVAIDRPTTTGYNLPQQQLPPPPQRSAYGNRPTVSGGMTNWERKNSVGDSGDSGSECRTPSLSPAAATGPSQLTYHKPTHGSGRLAAHAHNDIFTWVDTWTQTYI